MGIVIQRCWRASSEVEGVKGYFLNIATPLGISRSDPISLGNLNVVAQIPELEFDSNT